MADDIGWMDLLDALTRGSEAESGGAAHETWKCEQCGNATALVTVRCVCDYRLKACLPCSLVESKQAISNLITEHLDTCQPLRALVESSFQVRAR